MNSGNIIEINIANAVAILIMAVAGGFVLNAARKLIASRTQQSQAA